MGSKRQKGAKGRGPSLVASILVSLCLASAATAEQAPDTILIVDGSGSMSASIDGVPRIDVARTAIREALPDLTLDRRLGLATFGHRRKGTCTEGEVLKEPTFAAEALVSVALDEVTPLGRTSLVNTLRTAAKALSAETTPAVIVVVADGADVCASDPCSEVAALIDESHDLRIDLVALGVRDESELATLRCMARDSDGLFRQTETVEGLAAALRASAALDDAKPASPAEQTAAFDENADPVDVRLAASLGVGGPEIGEDLTWTLQRGLQTLEGPTATAALNVSLRPGAYRARVVRGADGAEANMAFLVEPETATVTLVLPDLLPAATLLAPVRGEAGDTVPVSWSGPGTPGDFVSVTRADADPDDHIDRRYVQDGTPLPIVLPPDPGTYEVRYVQVSEETGPQVLARQKVSVDPVTASLSVPTDVEAGSRASILWDGPNYDGDYLSIAREGEESALFYAFTMEGSPTSLPIPSEPGRYEVRYVMGNGDRVLATEMVDVIGVSARVEAPERLLASSMVDVRWTGPNNSGDYIAVRRVGGTRSLSYALTSEGSPARVRLPDELGEYELAYVLAVGRQVLASIPITISETGALMEPVSPLVAGSIAEIAWQGPGNSRDIIAVREPGRERILEYNFARIRNPLPVRMPTTPGTYELVYILENEAGVLDKTTIEVLGTGASLSVSDQHLPAGGLVSVSWTGPGNRGDIVGIRPRGEDRLISFAYTVTKAPIVLRLPSVAGEYEFVYLLGAEREPLATLSAEVTEVGARILPPDRLEAGSQVEIGWEGPDNRGDYIAIRRPGSPDDLQYAFTARGNPLQLRLPPEAGAYELVYVLTGSAEVIETLAVETKAPDATVSPPSVLIGGSTVAIPWNGPNNRGDYIAIRRPGSRQDAAYVFTGRGSPSMLRIPADPGTYEVSYVLASGRTSIASTSVEVRQPEASLPEQPVAQAGGAIEVDWSGPGNEGDFIAVRSEGDRRNLQYVPVEQGLPALVRVPAEAGVYQLLYVLGVGNTVIASIPLTVEAASARIAQPSSDLRPGETIPVTWYGPDNPGDYIAVRHPGAARTYPPVFTRLGTPAQVTLPNAPGTYELVYVLDVNDTVIEAIPIDVR